MLGPIIVHMGSPEASIAAVLSMDSVVGSCCLMLSFSSRPRIATAWQAASGPATTSAS